MFEGCFQLFIFNFFFVYFNYQIARGVIFFDLRPRGLFVFFDIGFFATIT